MVNILEFYDSEQKKVVPVSGSGSSGNCPKVETKETETEDAVQYLRFSDLENSCEGKKVHVVTRKRDQASTGTFCNSQPSVNRNIAYRITRSKEGSPAKLVIKATERLNLGSKVYPVGLFDPLTAKTELELKEVRDVTTDDWTPTEATESCTEVNVADWKNPETQEQLLQKAKEGFKMYDHCIHQLDSSNNLDDQDITTTLLGLTKALKHLNKASLETLYQSLEGQAKNSAFFQLLGLVGTSDSFQVVKEIYLKSLTDGGNSYSVGDALSGYFERIDPKSATMDVKTIREMHKFWQKIAQSDKTNDRLENGVILVSSALLFEKCIKNGASDPNCPPADRITTRLSEFDPENKDEDSVLLKTKIIANLEFKEGIPLLKSILTDRTRPLFLRTAAAWAFKRVARRHAADVKDFLLKTFFDRTEDHEIRIAAYVAIAKSGAYTELSSIVQYVVDNSDNEDRQVVSYIVSSITALRQSRNPVGSSCDDFTSRAAALYDNIVSKAAEKLGPRDIFDSAVYALSSFDAKEKVLASVIASKSDVVPRGVYLSLRDPLQHRSFILSAVTDGVLYSNLAQLKKAYQEMKKQDKQENPQVKEALDAIFAKVQGKPTSANFSLTVAERVDGTEMVFERFTRPEAILQRLLARTVSMERHLRSLHRYNSLMVKTHTESGLKVKFITSQAAVTSVEIPIFNLGQMSRSGVPVSIRYTYKFLSRTVYASFGYLPDSKFKYLTGRTTDKAIQVPRNVTLTVMQKQQDQLSWTSVTGKSEPLQGAVSKDVFYRSLTPVSGNLEEMTEWRRLIRKDTRPVETQIYGHGYVGLGLSVQKSADYSRPPAWKSPLSRWCYRYQEIDDQVSPYTFKVSFTKDPNNDATPHISYQIHAVQGHKDGQYVQLFGLTIDNPKDAATKSIRIVAGKAVQTNDPNKRKALVSYENNVKKLYVRSQYVVQMPETSLPIPAVTKGGEWLDAYPTEKIKMDGKAKFSSSGRSEFSLEGDVNDLLSGVGDEPDATAEGEFYRTDEQIQLYTSRENSVDTNGENYYSKLIARSLAHPGCSFKSWDFLLKFHGLKAQMELKKPLNPQVRHLYRRVKMLLTKVHYNNMKYDIDDKIEEGKLKVWVNSTVDSKKSDLIIQDKSGKQSFTGFKSTFILPWFRPSTSPLKVFYHNTLNLPVCTLTLGDKPEVETFDRRDVPVEDLQAGCEYLLVSNCRGRKTLAITYNREKDEYTILYDHKHKVVVTSKGFLLNGEAQPEVSGLVKKVDDMVLASYKGILAVKLPNRITFIRESGASTGYVQASRIFRGRLCGLCGDFDGDSANDDVSSVSDFGVSGQCSVAANAA